MTHLAVLLLVLASAPAAPEAALPARPFPLPPTVLSDLFPQPWSTDAEALARDVVRRHFSEALGKDVTTVARGVRWIHEDDLRRVLVTDVGIRVAGLDVFDRRARVTLVEMHDGRFRALAVSGNLEAPPASRRLVRAAARIADATVTQARAIRTARSASGLPANGPAHAEKGLDGPAGGPFRIVWRVRSSATGEASSTETWIDATTGTVLGFRDARVFAAGTGLVFDPNPVQQTQSLWSDQNDSPSSIPASLYATRTLQRLDGSGWLRGLWVDLTPTSASTREPTLVFDYDRGDDRFEPVVAYFHADTFQQRIQDLGFFSLNAESQRIQAHGTPADSSWYDTAKDLIVLGDGGVDDGEDPEIVIHEYTHAIHYDVGAAGPLYENRAMGEGYGDYFAATQSSDPRVGEWDATSYSTAQPLPYLRRVDGNKTYPADVTGTSVHADGEIWSAALWDLRGALGAAVADPLILQGMVTGGYNPSMPVAANALLSADTILFGGALRPVVQGTLRNRGLLPGGQLHVSDTTPLPGQTISLTLSGAAPGAPYLFLPSFQIHPVSLGAGLTLDVGMDLLAFVPAIPGLLGVTSSTGNASAPFTYPNATSWVGWTLYWQALEWNPQSGGLDMVSNLVPTTVHDKS